MRSFDLAPFRRHYVRDYTPRIILFNWDVINSLRKKKTTVQKPKIVTEEATISEESGELERDDEKSHIDEVMVEMEPEPVVQPVIIVALPSCPPTPPPPPPPVVRFPSPVVVRRFPRVCGWVNLCRRRDCQYAHSINELLIRTCDYGRRCRRGDTCKFKHDSETNSQYWNRLCLLNKRS